MKKFLSCFLSRGVIILLTIGILMFAFSLGDTIISFKSPVSFEDILDGEKVEEGDRISGDIIVSFGAFASEDTVTTKNGVKSTSKDTAQYYVLPGWDDNTYIGIKINKKDNADVEKNSNETLDWLYGGSIPSTTPKFEGKVIEMGGELAGYFEDWLIDFGFEKSDVASMGSFLVIVPRVFLAARILCGIGFVLIIIALLIVIKKYRVLSKQDSMAAMYQSQYGGGYQGTGTSDGMGGMDTPQSGSYNLNGTSYTYGQQNDNSNNNNNNI